MAESKITATDRLRKEGRWEEASLWREEVSDVPIVYVRTLPGVYASMLSPSVDPPWMGWTG
jgi:hypothetical protein